MQNELRDRVVSFDRSVSGREPYLSTGSEIRVGQIRKPLNQSFARLMGGNQIYLVPRANRQDSKRVRELSRPRLASRSEDDLASAIAFLVLAGSLFASLLQFFASLPALP